MERCYKEKVLTCLWRSRLARGTPQGRDVQKENLPGWQSALKWVLREVQPGSTPPGHTAELPSPVLPGLTGSFPQVLNQWFRPWLNSYHMCGYYNSTLSAVRRCVKMQRFCCFTGCHCKVHACGFGEWQELRIWCIALTFELGLCDGVAVSSAHLDQHWVMVLPCLTSQSSDESSLLLPAHPSHSGCSICYLFGWRLEGKPQCISVLRGSLSGQWHFLPSLLILHDAFMARTSGELPIVVCDKVINARMTEECWCWRYVALNVIGSLELEGTFKGYLVQLPCHSQGHLRFDQVPRTWSSLTLKFLHWRKDKNPLSFQKSGAGCTSTPCMFLCRCCQIPFFTKLSQPIWDIWL